MFRPLSFSHVATLGLLALLAIAACGKAEEESPATGQLAAPVTTSAAQNACSKVVSEISVGLSSAPPAYQISSAYASTAGAAAKWEETPPDPSDPNGPHVTVSQFRSYSADAQVFVCILSGEFGAPGNGQEGQPPYISALYIITPTGSIEPMEFGPKPITPDMAPPATSRSP